MPDTDPRVREIITMYNLVGPEQQCAMYFSVKGLYEGAPKRELAKVLVFPTKPRSGRDKRR